MVATDRYSIINCSEVFQKIHKKTPVQESLFNKDVGFSLQFYYEKTLTQETSLTICKYAFFRNTPSTHFNEARQARQAHHFIKLANFLEHAKHAIS